MQKTNIDNIMKRVILTGNVQEMFGESYGHANEKFRQQVLVGAGTVNARFQHKLPSDPTVGVYMICSWINSWAILQKKQEGDLQQKGAQQPRMTASDFSGLAKQWVPLARRLVA